MTKGSNPLRRAAAIMDVVAASEGGLTASEISTAVDIPLPSTHRLVQSLADVGYVSGGGRGGLYQLGPRFHRQAHSSLRVESLRELAEPMLLPLADQFQETVFLTCLKGSRVSLAATVFPSPTLTSRSFFHPGEVFPTHASSSGKVITAHQSGAFIDRALERPREAFRPNTIVDPDQLRAELAAVRKQGFAIIDDELEEGDYAISCPVWAGDEVLYSVGVVGFRDRILNAHNPADIVAKLKSLASTLSPILERAALGGRS